MDVTADTLLTILLSGLLAALITVSGNVYASRNSVRVTLVGIAAENQRREQAHLREVAAELVEAFGEFADATQVMVAHLSSDVLFSKPTHDPARAPTPDELRFRERRKANYARIFAARTALNRAHSRWLIETGMDTEDGGAVTTIVHTTHDYLRHLGKLGDSERRSMDIEAMECLQRVAANQMSAMGNSMLEVLRRKVADSAPPTEMPRPLLGARATALVLLAATLVSAVIWWRS